MKTHFIALILFAITSSALSIQKTSDPTQPYRSLDHIAAFNFYRTQLTDKYCSWYYEYQTLKGKVQNGRREAGSIQEGYLACVKQIPKGQKTNIPYRPGRNLAAVKLSVPAAVTAYRYARDMCKNKHYGHKGRDGSMPIDRLKRMGSFANGGMANENIGFSTLTHSPLIWITKYHVDDGVANRGHRKNLISDISHSGIAVYRGESELRWLKISGKKQVSFNVMNGVKSYNRGSGCSSSAVREVQMSQSEEGQTGVPSRFGNIDDGVDAAGNVKPKIIKSFESNFQDAPGARVKCHRSYNRAIQSHVKNRSARPNGEKCFKEQACAWKGYASSATTCNFDYICCMKGQVLRAANVVPSA